MQTLSPSLVLGAYAEPLLDGRRVALFGDATSSLPLELVERGARAVHVYDPVAARAAQGAAANRSKQISVLPLDTADIAVRDGAFDVAIVEDLSSVEGAGKLLARVRRALSPRGTTIVACPNPDAKLALVPRTAAGKTASLGYYDLFDLVSAEFSEVRMLGQTPFVGYAVVDFAPEGEPEVSIDSGLVPGGSEEPEWFVAVASAAPIDVEAFSVVQLPAARVLVSGTDAKTAEELRVSRLSEARLLERNAALEAEIDSRRVAPTAPPPNEEAVGRVRTLEGEIDKREAWISELEARSTAADARAASALADVEVLRDSQKRAVLLESTRADQERRLSELTSENVALGKKLSALAADKERLDRRLAERDLDVERLSQASTEDGPDDVARLELALKDRAERIRCLEAELREAERVGKELVRELASARSAPATAAPVAGGALPLSAENARLRADLEALGWTVQELEGRLSHASPAPR